MNSRSEYLVRSAALILALVLVFSVSSIAVARWIFSSIDDNSSYWKDGALAGAFVGFSILALRINWRSALVVAAILLVLYSTAYYFFLASMGI